MGKELLLVAEAVSNEKGVAKDVVFEAIQYALESATKKLSQDDISVRVALDTKSGDYETFRQWEILADEDIEYPDRQLTLEQAQKKQASCEVGDVIEEPMDSIEFGRIAAQAARQAIFQKVREAERRLVVEQYIDKVGQLVTGIVKKVTRDNIIVDLGGKAEACLPRSQILPGEIFRISDRVRAYLYEVSEQAKGAQLFLSRTHTNMLVELFRIEVPEIGEGVIEIRGAARDSGNRAKLAVKTNDGRIDPVGACVGMRGARVQAVSSELAGERVDIIVWDDNPAQLVINAMAPAEISSIVVDEDAHTMDLAVPAESLSQAIGKSGQNVRLATELTGWELNVMSQADFDNKTSSESESIIELFCSALDVDEEVAELLVASGFSSVEEVAYVPEAELMEVEGFDLEIVELLRERANDVLLAKALSGDDEAVADELKNLEGMTSEIATQLGKMNIMTVEDLAEQSIDDLLVIDGMTEEKAGALIMKAREPWFQD